MATLLKKPVRRELNRVRATKNGRIELPDKTGYVTMNARPVIVELSPADIIRFRVKGTQRRSEMHLATAMGIAQALTMYQNWESRVEEYKKKKAAGYRRLRKPTMPKNLPLGNYLRKVLRAIV